MMAIHSVVVLLTLYSSVSQNPDSLITRARNNGGKAGDAIAINFAVPSIEDLAPDATIVVRAKVESSRTKLSPDENDVLTEYQLVPIRFYKGSMPEGVQRLTVTRLGGKLFVDNLELTTTTNAFPEGESPKVNNELIVFLAPVQQEGGDYEIVGGPFGAFYVVDGTVTALTRMVTNRRGDSPQGIDAFEERLALVVR